MLDRGFSSEQLGLERNFDEHVRAQHEGSAIQEIATENHGSNHGASSGLAVVGIISVQAVFAAYGILAKKVLQGGLNPIAFALLRELSSSVVFLIASLVLVPRSGWPASNDAGRFTLCGASMFGNVFLNLLGLDLTTPSMVALLQPTQPIFASMLAFALGHERMTLRKTLGVAVCVSGGLLTTLWKNGGLGLDGGSLVVLAQCVCGANYVVQQRPLMHSGYSPIIVSGVSYLIATVFTVIVGVIYFVMNAGDQERVRWWDNSPFFALVLIYCIFFTTVYNYTVVAWVTGRLGATIVTLFLMLQGVFTCAAELAFFGKPIGLGSAVGSVLVFVGLLLVVLDGSCSSGYVPARENLPPSPEDN
mmetsp:Transcript_61147/g.162466  ORF Transcript_61147/g.162466 Transcript_61147/m.162466 type:complete len:361 (-) Transcript_61147:6-1088(-)